MQNILNKLQTILHSQFGYRSELEWRGLTQPGSPAPVAEPALSFPLYEPKCQKPFAFFKIYNVDFDSTHPRYKEISDLVQMTLQSYIDLMGRLETTQTLSDYLQIELEPQKVIKFHPEMARKQLPAAPPVPTPAEPPAYEMEAPAMKHRELLLFSRSREVLDQLALAIHDQSQNHFFIRMDYMPETFLTSLNDLTGMTKTTLYIPALDQLSPIQQKTLETYFLISQKEPTLLILAGTQFTASDLIVKQDAQPGLLKHFHFFHLMMNEVNSTSLRLESLTHAALAILEIEHSNYHHDPYRALHTKSYNLIPSTTDLQPTVH